MTRAMAAGALVCALLLTSACGGDSSSSKGTPSPSPTSASPSASATPSAPALPEAAKKNTKAGAIAFVRHYVELINHAQATGAVDDLRDAELPGCRSCANGRAFLQSVYDAGGHIRGGRIRFTADSANRGPKSGWIVLGGFRVAKQDIVHGDGKPVEHLAAGKTPVTFELRYIDQELKVAQWSRGN